MNTITKTAITLAIGMLFAAPLPAAEKSTKSRTSPASAKKTAPEKKYASLKAEFNEKCPAFTADWNKAITSGTPDEFLTLAKHKENKRVIEIGGSHNFADHFQSAFSVFASAGLSPHFASAPHDDSDAVIEVAAGGVVGLPLVGVFSTPIQPAPAFPGFAPQQGEKCEMRDLAVSPGFPFVTSEENQAWFRIKNENVGNLTLRFSVQIPPDTVPGDLKLTVSALAVGPREGRAAREKVEKTYPIRIVPAPAWTREALLCLWYPGVEAGRTLTDIKGTTDNSRARAQATVDALRNRLEKIAADPDCTLKEFARSLLDHPALPKSGTTNR